MKYLLGICSLLIICLWIQSCEQEEIVNTGLEGTWNVVDVTGGWSGGGVEPNFDQLKFDTDLNFEILDMGEVLIKGHLEEIEHPVFEYFVKLITDEVLVNQIVELMFDNEKAVMLDGNDLQLMGDCCDRNNYFFERD